MPAPRKYKDNAARQEAYRKRQRKAQEALVQAQKALVAEVTLPAPHGIYTMPSTKRWKALHGRSHAALEILLDEMTSYRDDRTEEWQETDRGSEFQELLDLVETAFNAVDEIEIL